MIKISCKKAPKIKKFFGLIESNGDHKLEFYSILKFINKFTITRKCKYCGYIVENNFLTKFDLKELGVGKDIIEYADSYENIFMGLHRTVYFEHFYKNRIK